MIGAILLGFAAGLVAGLLGVGGGILFVPALALLLGLDQVDAEATSLLAIIPVALVGAARQRRYGNVRLREAALTGVLAVPGAVGGVAVVNAIPQRLAEILFAILTLFVAAQMGLRALKPEPVLEGALDGGVDGVEPVERQRLR
jgi:uncharacterized membrane protein YfcA